MLGTKIGNLVPNLVSAATLGADASLYVWSGGPRRWVVQLVVLVPNLVSAATLGVGALNYVRGVSLWYWVPELTVWYPALSCERYPLSWCSRRLNFPPS